MKIVERAWEIQHTIESKLAFFFIFQCSSRFWFFLFAAAVGVLGFVEVLYFDIVASSLDVGLFDLLLFDSGVPVFMNPLFTFFCLVPIFLIYFLGEV